jgi:hypothetical protein
VFTNLKTGEGLDKVIDWLQEQQARGLTASGRPPLATHGHHHHDHEQSVDT